jgi:hypothetical protein
MKGTYNMGTSFMELRFYFHKITFIFIILFTTLHETQYTGHLKLLAEASGLFTHSLFYLIICKTACLECIFWGIGKRWTLDGAKSYL